MKYTQPPGEIDGAPYVNGNLSAGIEGSEVPAAAIEHPMRELAHLIQFAGLTPNESDLEQVRKAIAEMISIATGGGDTSNFVTFPIARARLPIFPEALTADGKINVTSPSAGSVLVPPTVNFQQRGIFPVSTSDYTELERTFDTLANKTYHLRWNPTDGFALKDVADAGYNPTAVAEQNSIFDSTYDDMLISRVVTNASNVAAITNLVNRTGLAHYNQEVGATPSFTGNGGYQYTRTDALNWSRTPTPCIWGGISADAVSSGSLEGGASVSEITGLNRYSISGLTFIDWSTPFSGGGIGARLGISATA